MNQSHYYSATDGLGPGTNHYVISVLGRRVNITVTPIPQTPPDTGGGNGGWIPDPRKQKYFVTVSVTVKGKEYKHSREVDNTGLGTIEKVIASFTKASVLYNDVKIAVADFSLKMLKRININIKHKNRK